MSEIVGPVAVSSALSVGNDRDYPRSTHLDIDDQTLVIQL